MKPPKYKLGDIVLFKPISKGFYLTQYQVIEAIYYSTNGWNYHLGNDLRKDCPTQYVLENQIIGKVK